MACTGWIESSALLKNVSKEIQMPVIKETGCTWKTIKVKVI